MPVILATWKAKIHIRKVTLPDPISKITGVKRARGVS
jgi:hypothetical protein